MPARTSSASMVRGTSRRSERGLTLIETLVAVTVLVAIMIGAAIVFLFPKRDDEQRLLAAYHAEDAAG